MSLYVPCRKGGGARKLCGLCQWVKRKLAPLLSADLHLPLFVSDIFPSFGMNERVSGEEGGWKLCKGDERMDVA